MNKKVDELQKRISSLPKGYISNKKIQGKVRHYLQWSENGKIKSKYIPDDEYEETKRDIETRKTLEKQLKSLKTDVIPPHIPEFKTNVYVGDKLRSLARVTEGLSKRDCFKSLLSFLNGGITPRICSVYGLRRTGKTTLLLQSISEIGDDRFDKTAYIKIRKGQSMSMLDSDLKLLFDNGYRYIFIDEITFLDDFIDTASLLSDIYAMMGMKIVISGTDSLGIWLASKAELYDRTYLIHTTWIPFSEHSRLLNTDDVDEYIRYGGTLRAGETDFDDEELKSEEVSFRDDETTRRYIDTAICGNIQHSLRCFEDGAHFRKLRELYEKDELTSAINRVIESMNHRFVLDVLVNDFKSNDLHLAKKNLLKEKNPNLRSKALEIIDESEVVKRLMGILEIENQGNQIVKISDEHVREIKEYLMALELIEECPVRYLGASKNEDGSNILFTQPGMRYCQAQALVFSLKKDKMFDSLSESEKDYVASKILDEVKGRMLEEIVLYETMRKLKKTHEVFKLEFIEGEFDMVVMNKATYECSIYEIKHSKEINAHQYRHLIDQDKCAELERRYGPIISKIVLYRGENVTLDNGVEYVNVTSYLNSIAK